MHQCALRPMRSGRSSSMCCASMVLLVTSSRTVPIEPFRAPGCPPDQHVIRATATLDHLIWSVEHRFNSVSRSLQEPQAGPEPPQLCRFGPETGPRSPSSRSTLFGARSCSISGLGVRSRSCDPDSPASRSALRPASLSPSRPFAGSASIASSAAIRSPVTGGNRCLTDWRWRCGRRAPIFHPRRRKDLWS